MMIANVVGSMISTYPNASEFDPLILTYPNLIHLSKLDKWEELAILDKCWINEVGQVRNTTLDSILFG